MKKYAIPALLLLVGNEILSLEALTVLGIMILADLIKGGILQ